MIKYNETYSINNGQESIVFKEGKGNSITGDYIGGTLTGTLEGNVLKATWHNKKTNGAGLIEFTFTENGFDCKWKQGIEAGPMRGKWTGKLPEAKPKAVKETATKKETKTTPQAAPKPKEVEKIVSKASIVQEDEEDETETVYYTVSVRIDNKYKKPGKSLDYDYIYEQAQWSVNSLPGVDSSRTKTFRCYVKGDKGKLIKLTKEIILHFISDYQLMGYDIGNCLIESDYSRDQSSLIKASYLNEDAKKPYFKFTILSITKE